MSQSSRSGTINFTVLTLFPDLIKNYLSDALLSKAIHQNKVRVNVISLRSFSIGNYKSVDDIPYGGGDGMVLKANILEKSIEDLKKKSKKNTHFEVIYLSPQGKKWDHKQAKEKAAVWSQMVDESQAVNAHENQSTSEKEIVLVCGRYAGVDQRFIKKYVSAEISIGDYILSGGELAALVLIESISRYIPGVLGDEDSSKHDSFENNWLEAPQFTRPQVWNELNVPAVLSSGNHQKISEWKKFVSYFVTLKKRPDIFELNFSQENISVTALKKYYDQIEDSEKKALQIENIDFNVLAQKGVKHD